MPSERPPKVFISYSHDSPEHEDRVLALSDRLLNDGVDVILDQFENPPPASWPKWMEAGMDSSDFILVVCSANYLAKVQGKARKGAGKGVKWESLLSYQQIYDNDSDSSRFIPVLLKGGKYEHIPDPIRGGSHYRPENDAEYEKLVRHITNQPETPKPKPGPLRKLPPRQRQAAKTPVIKAVQVPAVSTPWNVPHLRNDAFTGREQILSDLHGDLVKKGKQALSGLGGVGKTQIAVEYAYRHREEYTAVLWTFADTDQSVRSGYGQIASLLNLPEKDATEQAKVTEALLRWLEENPDWLLVLDNADDPSMVKQFLPQQSKGHMLLTSRAHQFQKIGIFSPREVDVLSPKEAREFLLLRTGKNPDAKSLEADELAKALGYLPLALEQAAAYMVENGAGFASYLTGYKKQRQTLLNKQGPILGNEPKEQQKRTVATTWAVNFADIERNFPASADLLRLSAFLAPDAIPLELFETGVEEMPENLAAKLAEAPDNHLVLDELLSPLLRYSLIRRDDEKRTYSIHPLVQEVVRDGLEKEQQAWAENSVRIVNAIFPSTQFERWDRCDRLLSHSRACAGLIRLWGIESEEAARLLNQAGLYLKLRAEAAQAEPLHRQSLAIYENILGVEHPTTARGMNNLATILDDMGRHEEARPLYSRALAIYEKTVGRENPETAICLNNLADSYRLLDNYQDAEKLFLEAFAITERTRGPDHPETAARLHNLAQIYRLQGQLEKAEPLLRRVVATWEKVLDAGHPFKAYGLNALAVLVDAQGKFAEAEPLYRRALEIREKALGQSHPSTQVVRCNLIQFYREQNRNAEADALEKAAKEKLSKSNCT